MSEKPTEPSGSEMYDQWVLQIINRSKEAWNDLIEAFGSRLRKDIHASLRIEGLPTALAEDVEQETWLRALRGITTFEWIDEDHFYYWLRVTSKNIIRELGRGENRTASLEDMIHDDSGIELDNLLAKYGIDQASVEDQVDMAERMMYMERALMTLKPEEQEIFMRWALGEKPRFLAMIYNKRTGTISQLVQRTIQKIENHLRYIQSINLEDNDHE